MKNERTFFKTVKKQKHIDKNFFDKLSPKLDEIKDGFFNVTEMYNDNAVELVLTDEGNIQNIVFVEELVESVPIINGWIFISVKSFLKIEDGNIEMGAY